MNHIMTPCPLRTSLRPRIDTALKIFAFPFLVMILLPSFSFANIYKCTSDSGVITYSDEPCGENAVHAFDEYVMGIEDAAKLNVIKPNTKRGSYDYIEKDIIAHAKRVGAYILPDKKLNSFSIFKQSKSDNVNIIQWTATLHFGSNEFTSEWEIKILYEGILKDEKVGRYMARRIHNDRLKAIEISEDGAPFDPISMKNLRTFKKIKIGRWEYKR